MHRTLGMVAIDTRNVRDMAALRDRFTIRVYDFHSGVEQPRCFAHFRGEDILLPGCAIPHERLPWRTPPRVLPARGTGWLHSYQVDALTALLRNRSGLLTAPAGSGKTEIGVALVGTLRVATVVVCPTVEIVEQWRARITRRLAERAERVDTGDVSIVVDTFHTLRNRPEVLAGAGCIVVDEAHRTPCGSIERILGACPARYRYGLTATPERADGLSAAMPWLFGPGGHVIDRAETGATVTPVAVRTVQTGRHWPAGTIDQEQRAIAQDDTRNRLVARYFFGAINAERQTICLCRRLDQIKNLEKAVDNPGLVRILTSATGKREREQTISGLRAGTIRGIVATYQLAAEGLDVPGLSVLIMAAPTGNARLVEQACGRIARVAEGKPEPIVLDFLDKGYRAEYLYRKRVRVYRALGYCG